MYLRVLTCNVQARPIADNLDDEMRACEIAQRIASSRYHYDIVSLNEVFDQDPRVRFFDGGEYAATVTIA